MVERSRSESQDSPKAFITGASRGIGAETAKALATRGWNVGIGVREKTRKAEEVAQAIAGVNPDVESRIFQGDITVHRERGCIITDLELWTFRHKLAALVLNAAGGLEKGKEPNYALAINRDAQLSLVDGLEESLSPDGTIVYVTSHWAHLMGQIELPPYDYEPIASSKNDGEQALRDRIPELTKREIRLVVVAGGLVTGTFVGDYAVKRFPEFTEQQRTMGNVITAGDMGEAIADAIENTSLPSGHVVSVGAPLEVLLG